MAGRDARRTGVCGGAGGPGGAEDVPERAGGRGGLLAVQGVEGLREGVRLGRVAGYAAKPELVQDLILDVLFEDGRSG